MMPKQTKVTLPLSVIIHIYNSGYEAGHHYTVEGDFTPVHWKDMDSYHDDVVEELLEELTEE